MRRFAVTLRLAMFVLLVSLFLFFGYFFLGGGVWGFDGRGKREERGCWVGK